MSKRILVVVASLSGFAACSSGGGGGGSGGTTSTTGSGGTSTPSALNLLIADGFCQQAARCGQIAASEEKKCESDAAASAKMYTPVYSTDEAVKNKRLSYNATAGKACAADLAAEGCSVDAAFDDPADCDQVYTGLVAVGGVCMSSLECAAGNWCDAGASTGTDGCAGVCKANTATGATCDPNDPHCGAADYCDGTSMKCTTAATAEQACDDSPQCATGLFCKGFIPADDTTTPPTPETPGVCKGRGQLGDACTSGFFGDTDCQIGLTCPDTTSVCTAPLVAGSTCSSGSECADGLACIGVTSDPNTGDITMMGKCGPYLEVGAACVAGADETGCTLDTTCDMTTSVCTATGALNRTCDPMGFGGCGANLYCDGTTSTCLQAVAFGAACTPQMMDMDGFPIGDEPCHDGACDATTMLCALACMP